ncbi:MAG: (2Fe-2S)-binding protein [Deltaproteobacteria bacterium]|nr:(2Fe-2S)-binding protein [Deltaproteobacteria bacterium]
MPTFKLDDREIPFEPGETIIQAAHRAGIEIPHYCWHPGLSVAANCRMCLVEVLPPPGRPALSLAVMSWDESQGAYVDQKKPKLQPACQQGAADGMEVRAETSPHVLRARSSVQELLLLNHPVDCPICDQAGECRLQDYWLEHQSSSKRMRDEPVHKPKAVSFGPTIVYDAERCIVCTRCVRFSAEVAKDPVLSVRQRGNLNEITVAPGRSLDHPYSLMTEYVCPVGALTAKDFRFKARVWFLRSAKTVCQGCATGCNAFLDHDPRTGAVYRHRPRENAAVNRYWMCDEGMLDYRRIDERRITAAAVSGEASTLGSALDRAAVVLREAPRDRLGVVLSAQHSTEDNFALLGLARDVLGATSFFLGGRPAGQGDDVLRDADKNPNTRGVRELLGATPLGTMPELAAKVAAGAITELLVLGADVGELPDASALSGARVAVAVASAEGPLLSRPYVLLPATGYGEADGTYVNRAGLAQHSEEAVPARGDARPAWKLLAGIAARLGKDLGYRKLTELRGALGGAAAPAGAAE